MAKCKEAHHRLVPCRDQPKARQAHAAWCLDHRMQTGRFHQCIILVSVVCTHCRAVTRFHALHCIEIAISVTILTRLSRICLDCVLYDARERDLQNTEMQCLGTRVSLHVGLGELGKRNYFWRDLRIGWPSHSHRSLHSRAGRARLDLLVIVSPPLLWRPKAA